MKCRIYHFNLYTYISLVLMFAFLPIASSAMSQKEWKEYSKLSKTLEGKLEWVFPSQTEYLCSENNGLGVYYQFNYNSAGIQKNSYGNVFLTFSENGKKLTHKFLSEKYGRKFFWSQRVNTDVQSEYSTLVPIYLTDISHPNSIYLDNRILVVDLAGCNAEAEEFGVRQPNQICVKAIDTFRNAIDTHILDCRKNN